MQIFDLLINAIVQIALFSIIPFLYWLISGREQATFLNWLGLKKPIIDDKKKYAMFFLLVIVLLSFPSFLVLPLFVNTSDVATSQFMGQGTSALIPALIYAFLQTGLSEEVFFRGFLTKRLIDKFGFEVGNAIQGIVFGLIHGVMFISLAGVLGAIVISLITGITGWLLGWINEKQSNGSIISSWLLHGLANTLASIIAMFNLL